MRRRWAAAFAALVIGGSLVGAAAGPASATVADASSRCRSTSSWADVVALRTMTVWIKPGAKSYPVGGMAKIQVTVTRPAPQDPAGLGVPLPRESGVPAPDVTVGVGLHIGPVFSPGYARTDQNGKATVSIKIPGYAKAGPVGVDAYAYSIIAQTPCYTLQEDGYTHKTGLFSVK